MGTKKAAVLGAGAMGGFYAGRFHDAAGWKCTLIARGERYDRLKSEGLMINGKPYAIPVTHPDATTEPADLIIVALKHHHLAGAVDDLHNLVGDQTTIISVMNGLDSEAIIGSVYGMDKLLYAIAIGIDAVRQGNRITFSNPGKVIFGEAINSTEPSPRVRRVGVALDQARIAHETPADMLRTLWWKVMVNAGINQASAVMRAPYGVFQSSPEAQGLMKALMREVIALAKCVDVNLDERDIEEWCRYLNTLSPLGETSMLQDIKAGRKTEVDILGGKVVELGLAHQVPTPVNETVTRIIRVLEKRDQR